MGLGSWFQDNVVDPARGFVDNVADGDIGAVFDDIVKGSLGFITLGYSNKYDDMFLPDSSVDSAVGYEDRKQSSRNPVAERELVYGRIRKGGTVTYIETSGDNSQNLHMIVVLAANACDHIESIYFDDEVVATYSASLNGTELFDVVPEYEVDNVPMLRVQGVLNGGSSMPHSIYNDVPDPPNLTQDHAYTGCCYLYIQLSYERDIYRQGIPRISAIVRGKSDIYDPRTTSSGYSNNAALVALDYLRNDLGLGVPDSAIDMQSFIDGANYADENLYQYSSGSLEDRYTANGIARVNTEPFKNMESILKASGAYLAYSVGKWSYVRAEYVAPTLTLSEKDLAGSLSLSPSSGRSGRLNRVSGVFVSSETWERADFPAVEISAYVTNDQELFESTLDLGFVTSAYQAQRLAKLAIERSRYGLTIRAAFKFNALQLSVGDRVFLDLDQLGIIQRAFMIIEMELDLDSGVVLVLREDIAGVYSWTEANNKELVAPPSISVGSPDPVAPINFTIDEELYQTSTSNVIKVRALLSWEDPQGRTQSYDLQYRESGGNWKWVDSSIFGTSASIDDVKAGDYDFRIRPLNELAWVGPWVVYSGTLLGKLVPPPDVESLFIADDVLSWTYPNPPIDLAGFEVRTHQGDKQTWADATAVHTGVVSASRFDVRGLVAATTTFLVKAVDTSGVYSDNAAIVLVNTGDSIIQNVILTHDYEANTWPGTITNGAINGSNEIEADQVGGFYNPDGGSIFYDQVGANNFYEDEYKKLEYEFTFTVAAQDVGVQLSIDYTVVGNSAQLEYIPPGGGATYTPFSGIIPDVIAGEYKFKLLIPSQFGATAPKITGAILKLDVPDINERLEDVAIDALGTRLPITKTYRGIEFVSLTMQTDGSGVASLKVADKDHALGPLVYAYDAAGTAVNTTIDALIGGY